MIYRLLPSPSIVRSSYTPSISVIDVCVPSMAELKRSRRVSWAPDGNLCQVRLFLSEETPSQSRFGAQDNLQAKASWLWHATGDDSPPPGFAEPHASYRFRKEISQIPLVKWQCPYRIVLNPQWLVASGEESEEVDIQNQRERHVLEAIYPRQSSIPTNPVVSSDVQDSHSDDLHTPIIPITAAEDEDVTEQLIVASTSDSFQPQQLDSLMNLRSSEVQCTLTDFRFAMEQSQSNPLPDPHAERLPISSEPGAEPDIMAAASAAFTAIMRSNEDSLVDRDLLISILNSPHLLEKLVAESEALKNTPQPVSSVSATPPSVAAPPPPPQISLTAPFAWPISHYHSIPNAVAPIDMIRQLLPVPAIQVSSKPLASIPPVKDANYFKRLIQQHGEEKQEGSDQKNVQFRYQTIEGINGVQAVGHSSKRRDIKSKNPKPCSFFNSPRGCRNGTNCTYQHDSSFQQNMGQGKGAKRIKLANGIAGRH